MNGTTYYAPVLGGNNPSQYLTTCAIGGTFTEFVKGTTTSVNNNQPVPVTSFGNYIEVASVTATGGIITVQAEPDTSTYRSPLNGIELVAVPLNLNITRSGANTVLNWSAGFLLQATNLESPWTTNSAATSPYTVSATAPQMFYRVMVP